jgi:hypothetical protein
VKPTLSLLDREEMEQIHQAALDPAPGESMSKVA